MRILIAFILATIAPVCATALAQSCQNFEQVLSAASTHDPNVLISKADIALADSEILSAKSLRRPQLSAFVQSADGDPGLVNTDFNNQLGLRASLRIFDFGDSKLGVDAAKQERSAQLFRLMDVENQARLVAGLSYIDWLEAQATLDVIANRSAYFADARQRLEIALDLGGATRAEVAEISAEEAAAEGAAFQERSMRDLSAERISIATRSSLQPCRLSSQEELLIGPDLGELSGPSVDTTLVEYIDRNPLLQSLKASVGKYETQVKREERARLPVIEVVGITSMTANSGFSDTEYRDRIGVDVSVPILSGSSLKAQAQKARARASRARGEVEQFRRTLEREVRVGYLRMLALEAELEQRRRVTEFRELEFAAVEAEYLEGLRTISDLIDAKISMETTRLQELRLNYEHLRQKLELSALVDGFDRSLP